MQKFQTIEAMYDFVEQASNQALKEDANEIAEFLNAMPDNARKQAEHTIDCLLGWASFDMVIAGMEEFDG